MKLRATILGAIVAVTLSGCGIITIDQGRTPPLTTAMAQKLVEQHFDSCQDAMEFGQCADFLPDAPPLREYGWVRSVVVPREELTSTMFKPATSKYVLTAAGAKRCFAGFGGSTATDAGDDANTCDWMWAPATVRISKFMQHDDKADILGVVHFTPNPAIELYLRQHYASEVQTLAGSQGKPFDFKLTFGGDSGPENWRIGNPGNESMGGFFIGTIVIVGMIVVAAAGLGGKAKRKRQAVNPFADGPAPTIGFPKLEPTACVFDGQQQVKGPEDWITPKSWHTAPEIHMPTDKFHIEPDTGPDPYSSGPDLDMGSADVSWTEKK
jgi:hypothetical protein